MSEAAMDWGRLAGALLLIRPHGPARGQPRTIRADVTVLDGAEVGTVFAGVPIVPRALREHVESVIGSRVLGRLSEAQPWALLSVTDADKRLALSYLAR